MTGQLTEKPRQTEEKTQQSTFRNKYTQVFLVCSFFGPSFGFGFGWLLRRYHRCLVYQEEVCVILRFPACAARERKKIRLLFQTFALPLCTFSSHLFLFLFLFVAVIFDSVCLPVCLFVGMNFVRLCVRESVLLGCNADSIFVAVFLYWFDLGGIWDQMGKGERGFGGGGERRQYADNSNCGHSRHASVHPSLSL